MQKMWDRIMASRRHSRGSLVKPVSSITCPFQTLDLLCFNQCSLLLTGPKLSKIWINCLSSLVGWTDDVFMTVMRPKTKQHIQDKSRIIQRVKVFIIEKSIPGYSEPVSIIQWLLTSSKTDHSPKACLGEKRRFQFIFLRKNVFVLLLIDRTNGQKENKFVAQGIGDIGVKNSFCHR